MLRRITVVMTLAAAAFAACSDYDSEERDAPLDAGAEAATTDVDAGEDADVDAGVTEDAGAEAASHDGGADADADARSCVKPCDCDGDGYERKECSGDAGPFDCDDHDPERHPGVSVFSTRLPTSGSDGDWNCDGQIELGFRIVSCTSLVGLGCAGSGFKDDPGCGESGTFYECQANALNCAFIVSGERVQACR
ncbi:MAG: hypothetical protein KIT84_44995 [Labilithrix sp.]|nr:hypothetical protein [Labilithrix sp.]MCW5818240.1 hypothetical protein [Labilithrix sp.]